LRGIEQLGSEGVGRAFVGVPCPSGLRQALAEAGPGWRGVDADVRWVDPVVAHLTIRFLGRAARSELKALDESLAEIAARTPPVELAPGEPGAFPGWRRPRILWLGLEDSGALGPVAEGIEAAARGAGFPPEEREFRPHLTLGRVRSPRGAARAVAAVQGWRSGCSTAATSGPRDRATPRSPRTP
jgi:2'-5' RNA ligase